MNFLTRDKNLLLELYGFQYRSHLPNAAGDFLRKDVNFGYCKELDLEDFGITADECYVNIIAGKNNMVVEISVSIDDIGMEKLYELPYKDVFELINSGEDAMKMINEKINEFIDKYIL